MPRLPGEDENFLWFTCRDCGIRTYDPEDNGEPPGPSRCAACYDVWNKKWRAWYAWERLPFWKRWRTKEPEKPKVGG